ncbi:MAG: hypothetical protein ABI743_01420 [bacterium]
MRDALPWIVAVSVGVLLWISDVAASRAPAPEYIPSPIVSGHVAPADSL